MSRLKELIHEIHRRSMWQTLGIYAVASWIIYQVVLALFEGLGLPDWVPGTALVLLLIGLPIVLATAFVQEGAAPDGISSEPATPLEPDEEGQGPQASTRTRVSEGAIGGSPLREVFTWRNTLAGGVLAFALWGVLAAGWMLFAGAAEERSPAPAAGEHGTRTAVAVLPFANMSASEENAYFADGIHEDVLTHLSKVEDLTVLSRTSVLRYRNSEKRPGEIARELGADAVLEGSVRRVGNDVRIVVQLIDPGTEGHIWADTYDRTLDDVFQVQTEVAREVARSLEATLSPEEAERISKRPTESLAAYDLYLRGREALERSEPEENEEAIRLFRAALENDPQFALARAGLARAFVQRIRFGHPRSWMDSAVAAAQNAIELDPETAEAHWALGTAYEAQRRIHDALEAYREAVRLDPNHYRAVRDIGTVNQFLGRYDESIRWYRRAARLAPNNLAHRHSLAASYEFLGLYEAAKEWLAAVLELTPGSVAARVRLHNISLQQAFFHDDGDVGAVLTETEDLLRDVPGDPYAWTAAAGLAYGAREFERAAAYARESLRIAPDNEFFHWHYTETLLGLSLLMAGDTAEGRRVLRTALEENRRRLEEGAIRAVPWDVAAIHAALGEADAAVDRLEQAYENGFRHPQWLVIDPAFDGLRDDARFQQILERLEADLVVMRDRVEEQGLGQG